VALGQGFPRATLAEMGKPLCPFGSNANYIKINNKYGKEVKSFQCNCCARLEDDAYLNGASNLTEQPIKNIATYVGMKL